MYGGPTAAQLATLDSIDRIRAHCHCSEQVWQAVDRSLGDVASPTLFAMLPASTLKDTLRTVRVGAEPDARALQAMECTHVAYMWRVCRQSLMMEDIDPLADPTPPVGGGATPPAVAGASPTKKVKVSSVTDQMDDSEIDIMSRAELDQAHLNHIEMTGAEPQDDVEPTGEQVAALQDRIIRRGESPCMQTSRS